MHDERPGQGIEPNEPSEFSAHIATICRMVVESDTAPSVAERARVLAQAATLALGAYWGVLAPENGGLFWNTREAELDLAATVMSHIAGLLFEVGTLTDDNTTMDDAAMAERIETSDLVKSVADQLGDVWLSSLASVVAPAALQAIDDWAEAYVTYRVARAGGKGVDEATVALRRVTARLLSVEPRSDHEFATLIRIVCLLGLHARIKRENALPDSAAADTYERIHRRLDRLPNWVYAGVFDERFQPGWYLNLRLAPNDDARLILGLIQEAGPVARELIAVGVRRGGGESSEQSA